MGVNTKRVEPVEQLENVSGTEDCRHPEKEHRQGFRVVGAIVSRKQLKLPRNVRLAQNGLHLHLTGRILQLTPEHEVACPPDGDPVSPTPSRKDGHD